MPQTFVKRVEKSIGWMEIQTQTPWEVLLRRLMLVLSFELERLEWGDVGTIRVLSSAWFPTLSFYPSQKTLLEGKQNNLIELFGWNNFKANLMRLFSHCQLTENQLYHLNLLVPKLCTQVPHIRFMEVPCDILNFWGKHIFIGHLWDTQELLALVVTCSWFQH